jgi:hypothetical protein
LLNLLGFHYRTFLAAWPRQLNRYVASLFENQNKPARDLSLAHGARLAACVDRRKLAALTRFS